MLAERKIRFWLASFAFGLASSILLAGIARVGLYWFPPFWPGLCLSVAIKAMTGRSPTAVMELCSILAGNTLFYTWIFSRIVRAEISARGHLSRHFLP